VRTSNVTATAAAGRNGVAYGSAGDTV
jgi:hypothetical protein